MLSEVKTGFGPCFFFFLTFGCGFPPKPPKISPRFTKLTVGFLRCSSSLFPEGCSPDGFSSSGFSSGAFARLMRSETSGIIPFEIWSINC